MAVEAKDLANESKLTLAARAVKLGAQGLGALGALASIPAAASIMTGLYLTEGSGMSFGESSLVGAGAVGAATAVMLGVTALQDHFSDKDNAEARQKLANEMNTSYNVYGDIKGKDGAITLVNKDRPGNYMIMKPDQDSVKVAISPTASQADYNNFLTLSQNYAEEHNVSLKLLDCDQTTKNVIADMQITKDGKTIHIPISPQQERDAPILDTAHPDSDVEITKFIEKDRWDWKDTKPELKELVTYKQDGAKLEEPDLENKTPSSTVSFKDNNISYGPAV